jgi:hypothetical protein
VDALFQLDKTASSDGRQISLRQSETALNVIESTTVLAWMDTGAILLAVYDITAAGQHNILEDLIGT